MNLQPRKVAVHRSLVLDGNPVLLVSLRPDHAPMPEYRSHAQSKRPTTPREFFLPVEVYISNQAAAALRKVSMLLLSQRTAPSVVYKTAQPAEEGREERIFENSVRAER
jgi:hypothetical protein